MGGPHGVGCHNRIVKVGTGGFQPDSFRPLVVIFVYLVDKIILEYFHYLVTFE